MERLDKVLSNMGIGSRTDVKKLIKSEKVRVDGIVATDGAVKIDPELANVEVSGRKLTLRRFFYIMLNKPAGYLSATRDVMEKTVIDLLEPEYRRLKLFPAGRLDKDSRGLILLTNDGSMAHALLSPRRHVRKRYRVRYTGIIDRDAVKRFASGIEIDGGDKCLPAELTIVSSGEALVIIYEGKFHQVKRMMTTVGCAVTDLRRESIGPLELDEELREGEYRLLSKEEVKALEQTVAGV